MMDITTLGVVFWGFLLTLLSSLNFLTILAAIWCKPFDVDPGFEPEVTAISCMWNEAKVAERKIENMLEQDYPREKYEVIVVDNGSDDGTTEIVERYVEAGKIKAHFIRPHHELKSPGLDHAILKMAKGEIVCHSDADALMPRDWVRNLIQPFKDPSVGGVQGIIHCGDPYRSWLTAMRAIEDCFMYCCGFSGRQKLSGSAGVICGGNYALRKKALEGVGSHGTKTLVEDGEVAVQLQAKGWKIVTNKGAPSWQEEVETLGQYYAQRLRWDGGGMQLSRAYGLGAMGKNKFNFFLTLANGILQFPQFLATVMLLLALAGILPGVYLWMSLTVFMLHFAFLTAALLHFGEPRWLVACVPLFFFVDWIYWTATFVMALIKVYITKDLKWEKIWHPGVRLIIPTGETKSPSVAP